MAISQQNKTQIIRLIAEGECLNIYDLEEFYSWMEASYEALKLNPRFGTDSTNIAAHLVIPRR